MTLAREPESSTGELDDLPSDPATDAKPTARGEVASVGLIKTMLEALLDPFVLLRFNVDESGHPVGATIVAANQSALTDMGVGGEVIEREWRDVITHVYAKSLYTLAADVYQTGAPLTLIDFPGDTVGGDHHLDVRAVRVADGAVALSWRDVTTQHAERQALIESEELHRLITDDIADAVIRMDGSFYVTWVSPSFESLTGFRASDIIGKMGNVIASGADVTRVAEMMVAVSQGKRIDGARFRIRRVDGTERWVSLIAHRFTRANGESDGCVAVLRDVQPEVDAQIALEHRIGHDHLTGLANKDLQIERINTALRSSAHKRTYVGLLTIGVDQLRRINEGLTYSAGDDVLRAVAERISTAIGNDELVGRAAGDEFTVFIPDLGRPEDAGDVAQRICDAVRKPLPLDDRVIVPTVSIGIAVSGKKIEAHELLRHSTLAMRQAKHEGRDKWMFVDSKLAGEASTRIDLEEHVRLALEAGQIVPWFQPVVSLEDRTIVGYEALARWVMPDGTVIAPDRFIPIAEGNKMVVEVDKTILTQSIDVLHALPMTVHMAVNVSVATLGYPGYLEWLYNVLLENTELAPRLRLEVTETALLQVSEDILNRMRDIAGTGARWYADDFGVGYSSISYLRDLPIAGLKLDMSFTSGIKAGDQQSIRLAQGLAGLAHGLDIATVAEGVDSQIQVDVLLRQGWVEAQGWLFGKAQAVPATEVL